VGAIIKYILIFLIVTYLIRRVGAFFTTLFFGDQKERYRQDYRANEYNKSHGDQKIKIFRKPQQKEEKHFKGGEYVDYEEIK